MGLVSCCGCGREVGLLERAVVEVVHSTVGRVALRPMLRCWGRWRRGVWVLGRRFAFRGFPFVLGI